ncbi:uncharacterized protein SCODWIG_00181 [Saccharomycodes ludwigii]|uniref:Uncharacterized protein n=2 Tax=Saccharomycodes ludwigii TaxID=36035 RepID=A0A376B2R3_9ASCO|nr:uncharacterized protein SCODWIG_00181 [Saccharomycodes ludwigii]
MNNIYDASSSYLPGAGVGSSLSSSTDTRVQSEYKPNEERVFGPAFDSVNKNPGKKILKKKTEIRSNGPTLGIFISAMSIVLSAALIFLLGVNIVIQWRTISTTNNRGTIRKVSFIILSFLGIGFLISLNVLLFKKLNQIAMKKKTKYGLLPTEESFEMDEA